MNLLRQIAAVVGLSLRSLPSRLRPSIVMIAGVAGAVGATLALLSLSVSLRNMALSTIDPRLAIVLSTGSSDEFSSDLSPAEAAVILQAPEIQHDAKGAPAAQLEAVILVDVVRKVGSVKDDISLRGTGPVGLGLDKRFHLTAGRMFRPGADELIVGRKASSEYAGLNVGSRISLRGVTWTIVGAFDDGGGLGEREMLTDAQTEISAFGRTGYQTVMAELQSPAAIRRFSDALTSNPQLDVVVRPYGEYLAGELRQLTGVLNFVAYLVGGVMAAGAFLSALNTLYAAVDARRREIATLRAIGFGGLAILLSVVGEAIALALPGALLGGGAAWLLVNGRQASVGGLAYDLAITPNLIGLGLGAALLIGVVGAVAPAIRAVRLPVAEALRLT